MLSILDTSFFSLFLLLYYGKNLTCGGKNPNTAKKFAMGIGFLGLGFLVFAYSIHFISDAGKLPFSTLWIGWLLITTGELCLSPIGLSKVTQLSPKKSIAFFMGLWFLSSTVAHYIAGALAKSNYKWSNHKFRRNFRKIK